MIPDFSQQEQDSVGSLYRMNKNKLIKVLTYTNINILPLDDGVRVD
jgi:hypothetical protein